MPLEDVADADALPARDGAAVVQARHVHDRSKLGQRGAGACAWQKRQLPLGAVSRRACCACRHAAAVALDRFGPPERHALGARGRCPRAATATSSSPSRRSASTSPTRWSAAASTAATSRWTSPPASRSPARVRRGARGRAAARLRSSSASPSTAAATPTRSSRRGSRLHRRRRVDCDRRRGALFTQGVTAWYAVHRYGAVQPASRARPRRRRRPRRALHPVVRGGRRADAIATASTEAQARDRARPRRRRRRCSSDPETSPRAVRELTGGAAPTVVIDGVGGPLFAPSCARWPSTGATSSSASASQQPATLDVRALMPRGQTVVGFVVARVAEEDPAEPQRAFDAVQRACARRTAPSAGGGARPARDRACARADRVAAR